MEDSLCFYFLTPTDSLHPFPSDANWRKKWLSLRLMKLRALKQQIDANLESQDPNPPSSHDDYACCSRFRAPPTCVTALVTCPAMGAFVPDSNAILRARHDPRGSTAQSDSDDLITQPPPPTPFADLNQFVRRFQESDNSDADTIESADLFDSVNFIQPNASPRSAAAPVASEGSADIEVPAWTRISRRAPPDVESPFNNFNTYLEVHRRLEAAEVAARGGFGGELVEDVVSEPLGSALVVTIDVSGDEDSDEGAAASARLLAAWPARSYDRMEK